MRHVKIFIMIAHYIVLVRGGKGKGKSNQNTAAGGVTNSQVRVRDSVGQSQPPEINTGNSTNDNGNVELALYGQHGIVKNGRGRPTQTQTQMRMGSNNRNNRPNPSLLYRPHS